MVMRGYKEVSWKQAKGMMSEANFLKSLTDMDVDGITSPQVLHLLKIDDSFICLGNRDVPTRSIIKILLTYIIVNRGKWLRGARLTSKKQIKIYYGRSLTLHMYCFMLTDCV